MRYELIVDNFAGGGCASRGIEEATGRHVDIAINHNAQAIEMHKANHPKTKHYCEDVWHVDPVEACNGQPVGLAWFSPDCRHFSRAKGGKPVEKKIRGLAWVVLRWAAKVKPRVIILENVPEFVTWGPLAEDGKPDPNRKGETFNSFINALKRNGYKYEWKELKACDYGAPTIRKRFFLIARCDGKQIVWPEPTHGNPKTNTVKVGKLTPWRSAAECIDWSIPCPSIFDRKRPLAENTMRRIALGIFKFVINNPEPFIVQVNHSSDGFRGANLSEHFPTVTSKNGFGVVMPYITQYHGERKANEVWGQSVENPLMTVDTSNRYSLVATFLAKHYGGGYKGAGAGMDKPMPTVTTVDHNAIVTSNLIQLNRTSVGQELTTPLNTITAGGKKFGEVRAFLIKYYGQGLGQRVSDPIHTITAKDHFGVITIHGQDYQIVDIGMRMLTPRELFRAQGFPDSYIIDRNTNGRTLSKAFQVERCGNAVPPAFARALVESNLPELCNKKKDIAI